MICVTSWHVRNVFAVTICMVLFSQFLFVVLLNMCRWFRPLVALPNILPFTVSCSSELYLPIESLMHSRSLLFPALMAKRKSKKLQMNGNLLYIGWTACDCFAVGNVVLGGTRNCTSRFGCQKCSWYSLLCLTNSN